MSNRTYDGGKKMDDNQNIVDLDRVKNVNENISSQEDLYELADFFKVFADSTRMRILAALEIEELCVGDISYLLNMTQSAISHQLSVLKTNRLVKTRRDGKMIYYSLDDDHIKSIMKVGLTHIRER